MMVALCVLCMLFVLVCGALHLPVARAFRCAQVPASPPLLPVDKCFGVLIRSLLVPLNGLPLPGHGRTCAPHHSCIWAHLACELHGWAPRWSSVHRLHVIMPPLVEEAACGAHAQPPCSSVGWPS